MSTPDPALPPPGSDAEAQRQAVAALDEIGSEEAWATKPWRRSFIVGLCRYGNVSAACRLAGISRETVYQDRREDDAFAIAWAHALEIAADLIEQMLWRRATVGSVKVKTKLERNTRGEMVVVEEERTESVSDVAAMFFLNAMRPEKYRPAVKHQHTGSDGEPIRLEVTRPRTPERFKELLEIAAEMGWEPSPHPVIESNGHPAIEQGPGDSNGSGNSD